MANETTLRQVGDMQIKAEGDGWSLTFDVPPDFGGKHAGPGPTEMLAAALGACKALTGLAYVRHKRIPVEGLTVRVQREYAAKPQRVSRINVAISGVGDQLGDKKERFIAAMEACPVANTLKNPPEIELSVE